MGNIYILHFFFSDLAFPHFSTGLSWSPVTESEQKYLVLDNEPFMARTQDYVTKMDFWQQIFPC